MRLAACQQETRITAVSYGVCGADSAHAETPLMCTIVQHIENITASGCDGFVEHDIGKCMGGCGAQEDHCCQPDRFRDVEVEIDCSNGNTKTKMVEEILSCMCVCMDELDSISQS